MIAFGVAVVGLFDQHAWWRSAAIAGAVISTAGLILFWPKTISSPVISALVVNLLILGALLIAHWPKVDTVGA